MPHPIPPDASTALAELGERYFRTQHTYDPYNATLLGITEFDHLAGDPGQAASERAAADFATIDAELAALDLAGLDPAGRVDHGVLTVLSRGAGRDAHHALWAANASAKGYVSRQGLVFQAVPAMTIADTDGAERYEHRLAGLGSFLRALGERYREEAARGRVPTALGVTHAVAQLEGHLGLDLDADALLGPATRAGNPELRDRAGETIASSVRPAMAALADLLRTELLPVARPDDRVGIAHVPGGEEGYVDAVARHTTTELSPAEIHQIGLDTLAELEPRWSEVGRRALGVGDFPAIAERLRTDPALRFRTREEIVDVAERALERAQQAQDDWFPRYDIPPCVIEEINPIDAEGSALAYYRPPAVDGSRPGAHCLLSTHPQQRFRFEYEALAFHESVPGHHLQLATAQTLDLPRYRQHLDVEACSFNEGWGLYAERLAEEMGLYSSDIALLGMLSFTALRACRLVIDTGVHHLGWSRGQAVEFMWQHTATTRENATSEVDRYICWPGQALAYTIGQREIVRLRERARRELGPRFDLVGFHGAVLGSGALPLPVLDQTIARWTAGIAGPARGPLTEEASAWT
ncbi:Uncharacterized conserved protein, DUF885 familyt [Modestobacter sp. DSM 44400]|uniref:DUF885 domain-containing protein n=1 Tax=Modestobacter sp. DSM 44400 TaxID=1550230 RepID=UPI00089AA201|nr:DUF885 domain-containing protein [Modestobacter sp. DSM 44400]SDY12992.1 Uncharacterized conserved protein, DUF885 familyt [Modestobacter sp. DSM 44400]